MCGHARVFAPNRQACPVAREPNLHPRKDTIIIVVSSDLFVINRLCSKSQSWSRVRVSCLVRFVWLVGWCVCSHSCSRSTNWFRCLSIWGYTPILMITFVILFVITLALLLQCWWAWGSTHILNRHICGHSLIPVPDGHARPATWEPNLYPSEDCLFWSFSYVWSLSHSCSRWTSWSSYSRIQSLPT